MRYACRVGFWIFLPLLLMACSRNYSPRNGSEVPPPTPLVYAQRPKPVPAVVVVQPPKPKKEEKRTVVPFPIAAPPVKLAATPRNPRKNTVIMIDPGHGGEDYGTYSKTKPRYHEKYFNLSTAFLLRDFLEDLGYTTQLTRTDDVFIALEKRADIANNKNPTLFVSVHYNSAPSKDAEGVEVYYYQTDDDKDRTAKSKKLAQSVLSKVISHTQAKSRGVKSGNFAVIRQTTMPAILIEGGFLTNSDELEKIKSPAYIKQLALGIAEGVDEYVKKVILPAQK